jgi:hypothetical protein
MATPKVRAYGALPQTLPRQRSPLRHRPRLPGLGGAALQLLRRSQARDGQPRPAGAPRAAAGGARRRAARRHQERPRALALDRRGPPQGLMWTAAGSQPDLFFIAAPSGASRADRRFALGVCGPCAVCRPPESDPCRRPRGHSKQRPPQQSPVCVWEGSGQVRSYVRPVARRLPLAIMGVRLRARRHSGRRARGTAPCSAWPGLSRPQPFPSRGSALPAGSAGLAPAACHRAPERHTAASAAAAPRPFAW